ncbi:MAG: hypothetical protein ACFFB3_23030 [Candidatus Hodarchaeota archaeon]
MAIPEEIVGVLEVPAQNLYFTSGRVIVAKIGGSGLLGLFGAAGVAAEAYRQKKKKEELEQLSPESILTADKKNFAIPYSDIIRVEMKKPGRFSAAKIDFVTNGKTHKFILLQKKESFDNFTNLVRSVLPDQLSIVK